MFSSSTIQYFFCAPCFQHFLLYCRDILLWSRLFESLNASFVPMSIYLSWFGEVSVLSSLTKLSLLFLYATAPSSVSRILRFGPLVAWHSSWLLKLCFLVFSYRGLCLVCPQSYPSFLMFFFFLVGSIDDSYTMVFKISFTELSFSIFLVLFSKSQSACWIVSLNFWNLHLILPNSESLS